MQPLGKIGRKTNTQIEILMSISYEFIIYCDKCIGCVKNEFLSTNEVVEFLKISLA